MLNELITLQLLSFLTLFFFLNSTNVYTLWYLGGFYMILLGVYALVDDADIFVGFLWVIDLGVGLIFFIFIMHFSNFLHQKSVLSLDERYFYFYFFIFLFFSIFFYFFSNANSSYGNVFIQKSWIFFVSWYEYYAVFAARQITELQLLRQIYFSWSGFNFFLINFSLFYGLIAAIVFTFLLKKIFLFLSIAEFVNTPLLSNVNSFLFIRNQNFLKQQNTAAGTGVWTKKKKTIYDF